MKRRSFFRIIGLMLGLVIWFAPVLGHATFSADVTLNTSSLIGSPATVVFDFIDGDNTPDNSATISNFVFGSGSPAGNIITTGNAFGNLASTVSLNDGQFFNEFTENFTPGSLLSFRVDLTTNFAGGTPDSFTFSLLDSSGNPIPTSDPTGANALLAIDLGSTTSPQTYGNGSMGPPTVSQAAATPVPPTILLLGSGLAGMLVFKKRLRG